MDDKAKEDMIALYLVQEMSGAKHNEIETQIVLSHTTPYPEMAHDLLCLVRQLDKEVV